MASEIQARPPGTDRESRLDAFLEAHAAHDAGAIDLGEALIEDFPDMPGVRGKLARMKLDRNDHAGALELAREELERRPGQSKLLKVAALASGALHGGEAALPWLTALAEQGDGWANLQLAERAEKIRDGREALRRLDLAERAGYTVSNLLARRCFAAVLAQDGLQARLLFDQLPAEQQAPLSSKLRHLERSLKSLQRLRNSGRLHSLSSNQLKAWAGERGAQPFGQGEPELFITESGDMLGDRVPGSRSVVLVFGGIRDLEGAVLPRLDANLQLQRINTLYLSDPRRLFLMSGLESFGDYRQSLEGLRAVFARWKVEEVFCLGVSAGGYAAIAYGLDLRARRILTLAAPTTLVGPVMEADGRASILAGRVRAAVTDRNLDLRPLIEAAADPPQIINYYAVDSPKDVLQADHLRGLPNVILKPLTGRIGHDVAHHLAASGAYPQVIAELLAGRLPDEQGVADPP